MPTTASWVLTPLAPPPTPHRSPTHLHVRNQGVTLHGAGESSAPAAPYLVGSSRNAYGA